MLAERAWLRAHDRTLARGASAHQVTCWRRAVIVDLTRRARVRRSLTYVDVILSRERTATVRQPDAGARQVTYDLTRPVMISR
jgi:hypothetical protein